MIDWHEFFEYRDGVLYWKRRRNETRLERTWNGRFAGKPAGTTNPHGYVKIVLSQEGKKTFSAHRIIWEMFNGPIPDGLIIDHKNGLSNKIENLRLANTSQNMANGKKRRGRYPKGVRAHGKRYQAQIGVDYQKISLGTYDSPEEAHQAYMTAAKRLFGEFARPA